MHHDIIASIQKLYGSSKLYNICNSSYMSTRFDPNDKCGYIDKIYEIDF